MTTTDLPDATPPDAHQRRRVRRSTADRVGAGVAGGLGEYFGVDPVLFRVLFATSAFFGGAGILAYLIAWAIIPERGTEHAPIDGLIGELRRRRVPLWIVLVGLGVVLWAIAFSWWAPGPFLPVAVVAVILAVLVGRHEWRSDAEPAPADPATASTPVDLTKDSSTTRTPPPDRTGTPDRSTRTTHTWATEARSWYASAAAAHRVKQQRAQPVKRASLGALVVSLGVLAIVDSVADVQIQTYFWTGLGILGGGLVIGATLRRTPWALATLLPVFVAGSVAFAGSTTSFGDGVGHREWRPGSAAATDYRLAFGSGVLDLRSLPSAQQPVTFRVRIGAGKVEILAPPTMNLTVEARVHIGAVSYDVDDGLRRQSGVGIEQSVPPPAAATGAPVTVIADVADGEVTVTRLR